MPDILVEVRGSWLAGKQAAFLDAVHKACGIHKIFWPDDYTFVGCWLLCGVKARAAVASGRDLWISPGRDAEGVPSRMIL